MSVKIGYTTDHHFHHVSPLKRLDNYPESLLEKMEEVVDISVEQEFDALLFGGDTFHTYKPDPGLVRRLVKVLRKAQCPIYAILGNHDVPGNEQAAETRLIGLLKEFDDFPIRFLNQGEVVKVKNLPVKGINYYDGIETDLLKISNAKKSKVNALMMVHANITESEKIFRHCFYKDVNLESKYILTSHYHPKLGVLENSFGNVFVCPGAFSRLTDAGNDAERIPTMAVMTYDKSKMGIELVELKSAKKPEEIFNLNIAPKEFISREGLVDGVIEAMKVNDITGISLEEIVTSIAASENIPDEVKRLVLEKLHQVEVEQL